MDNETVKNSLSAFAYDQLFTKEFCQCKKFGHFALKDGTTKVWPCG
jgi:hypothetical protein